MHEPVRTVVEHAFDIIHVGLPPTDMLQYPLGGSQRCWRRGDVDIEACKLTLDAETLDELAAVVEAMRINPLPLLARVPSEFDMPCMRQLMLEVRTRLDNDIGVVLVDRLALDEMDVDDAKALYWIIGQLLGPPVAQQWIGTLLYDVTDTGTPFQYGVRGSYTNIELVFHTDNAFGKALPEYVGLLCLHPASSGGVSRFASLTSVHDQMLSAAPGLLERLYQPMLWDRQAEHAEGAPRIARAPMFRQVDGRLLARANPSLVRKGYELIGEVPDKSLDDALRLFSDLVEHPSAWFECPIERGQLQYLNNVDVAHYRSAFTDPPDSPSPRHLIRTWHRQHGARHYEG